MTALLLISFLIFVSYNGIIASVFGVPDSLSDSFYNIRKHNGGMLFTLFCWATAFPLLIFWIDILDYDWNFLPFIACVGLMFVGTAPAFKDHELERKVHIWSALICISASYLWSMLYGSIFITISFIIISGLLFFVLRKCKIYWVEMVAFMNIYIQLLIWKLYFISF